MRDAAAPVGKPDGFCCLSSTRGTIYFGSRVSRQVEAHQAYVYKLSITGGDAMGIVCSYLTVRLYL